VRLKDIGAIIPGPVSVLRSGGGMDHWILRTKTDAVSEKLCSLVSRIPDDGQSLKPSNSEYRELLIIRKLISKEKY
jgi:hypothetical protein